MCSVGQYLTSSSPLAILSFNQKYLISICFDFLPQEDRPLGRQLSRLIDVAYLQIQNAKRGYRPASTGGIGSASTVMELED